MITCLLTICFFSCRFTCFVFFFHVYTFSCLFFVFCFVQSFPCLQAINQALLLLFPGDFVLLVHLLWAFCMFVVCLFVCLFVVVFSNSFCCCCCCCCCCFGLVWSGLVWFDLVWFSLTLVGLCLGFGLPLFHTIQED